MAKTSSDENVKWKVRDVTMGIGAKTNCLFCKDTTGTGMHFHIEHVEDFERTKKVTLCPMCVMGHMIHETKINQILWND
jgi:hypothetical protein